MNASATAKAHASQSQNKAADPQTSAWVSANAGSGKTYVLVNRVIRFLLAGTLPERILCLTFTKAAAAEMTNRLFERLSQWAVTDEAQLRSELADVLERQPGARDVLTARRLFAQALETPGGLKIQTIHAFCESLLHRFPIEADVPAGFDVLDDASQRDILAACRAEVMERTGARGNPKLADALQYIISHVQQDRFDELLGEIIRSRSKLADFIQPFDTLAQGLERLAQTLGLEPGDDEASLFAEITDEGILTPEALGRVAENLLASTSSTDQKTGESLGDIWLIKDLAQRGTAYLDIFFTAKIFSSSRKPRARLATKYLAEEHPQDFEFLQQEQIRLEPLYERLKAFHVWRATAALLEIASEIIGGFIQAKRQRGLLDYDDLIQKTNSLLSETGAAWVLYKLDGGLDHILVDEAQDTSREQWQVIQALAEEFFSGESARNMERTLFAVGDEKQSIYSFQGADPAMFDAMRHYFARKSKAAAQGFAQVPLTVSFRSTELVLWAVDQVFADDRARAGLSAADIIESHQAVRLDEPGLIEIWPTEKPDEKQPENPWNAPLDWQSPETPRMRLAQKIADRIAGWLNDKTQLPAKGRAIVPDDILILVRKRGLFVDALVRALKQRNVPVAGADRMKLGQQIAVMDLIALAQAALLPDDDLTLAVVLKSPLIGLSEEDLFTLAHDRPGSLWQALHAKAASNAHLAMAHERLSHWFNLADYGTPFEFFSTILSPGKGRELFNSRLGAQANDPLDEFLNQALTFEQSHSPSLQGFLAWFEATQSEIKRDLAQAQGEVRIMTVHGAKGLEANIVILPDTCTGTDRRHDAPVLFLKDYQQPDIMPDIPVWPLNAGYDTQAINQARQASQTARDEEEHRLLYVAMTRARDWLIICGHEGKNNRQDGCWYDLAFDALEPHLTEVKNDIGDVIAWRKESGKQGAISPPGEETAPVQTKILPDWASEPAPGQAAPAPMIAPSKLTWPGDKTPPRNYNDIGSVLEGTSDARLKRGLIIHRLLQSLPALEEGKRLVAAQNYVGLPAHDLQPNEQTDLIYEALAVLSDPGLQALFGPDSRAEVPLAGWVQPSQDGVDPIAVSGLIDRLVVRNDEILILDYKTDRAVPESANDVPQNYIRQLAAYRAVLKKLYQEKLVKCNLLWTAAPALMDIPDDLLDKAL